MSQSIAIGRPSPVTLATTVKKIIALDAGNQVGARPTKLLLVTSDVPVHIVTAAEATDGGAMPTSSGFLTIPATIMPIEYDISGAAFLGLAADSAGTVRVELR